MLNQIKFLANNQCIHHLVLQRRSLLALNKTLPSVSLIINSFQNIQVANYRQNVYERPVNWVRRRGGGYDEKLTAENKEFLEELIIDKYKQKDSILKESPWERGKFDPNGVNKRIGVLAIKLGSMPQWTKEGKKIYTTLLQVCDNHVIDYIPPNIYMQKDKNNRSKDGQLGMALVGALSSDPRLYTKQYLDLFNNSGVPPKRKLTKFMITPNAAVQPGTPLYANHFRVGDYVDVSARTIGYGFQGVMKRWGFSGGPRSHGATKFHRKRGTIGSGRDRRPLKGMKMAGRMGGIWRSLKGLKIFRINTKYNVLYVQGAVMPGPNHSYVRIVDSCISSKRFSVSNPPPFPTYYKDDPDAEKMDVNIYDKVLHNFSEPTIKYANVEIKKMTKREGAKLAKIKS